MSNIISWDYGYRLEPRNKCGFLGLQLSWATLSTQNRTLCLLAGVYKQSVGNFLWFLPIQSRNPQYRGTRQHLCLRPLHRPFLKVTMAIGPKKPVGRWRPWSPTREPDPRRGDADGIIHANRDGSLPAECLKGRPCPLRPQIYKGSIARPFFFVRHPVSYAHLLMSCNFAVPKTNVYCLVFPSPLSCSHPASQLLSLTFTCCLSEHHWLSRNCIL